MNKTPSGPPHGPPSGLKGGEVPGTFANRRARRRLVHDTEATTKIMEEKLVKFTLALSDPRTEEFTYSQIFHGYEKEFREEVQRINEFRSSSRLLMDPMVFNDMFRPIETQRSGDGHMGLLRRLFINTQGYEIHPEAHLEEVPGN